MSKIDAATGQVLDDFEVRPEIAAEEAFRQGERLRAWARDVLPGFDALQESVDEYHEAVGSLYQASQRAAQRVLDEALEQGT